MATWAAALARISQGRSMALFLRVILPVFLQSLAIYYAYRTVKWHRTRQHETDQSAPSDSDVEPTQRKDPNRDRDPGGTSSAEDMSRG